MLTFLPLEQINEMDSWEGSQLNAAKEILAFELTKLVHGEEEAKKSQESARALFSSGNAAEMPTTVLTESDFLQGKIDVISLLVKTGLVTTRSEGRRAVEQGGVTINGEKINDIKTEYEIEELTKDGAIIKRGKKNFRKAIIK